jgi:hypothetical protein
VQPLQRRCPDYLRVGTASLPRGIEWSAATCVRWWRKVVWQTPTLGEIVPHSSPDAGRPLPLAGDPSGLASRWAVDGRFPGVNFNFTALGGHELLGIRTGTQWLTPVHVPGAAYEPMTPLSLSAAISLAV